MRKAVPLLPVRVLVRLLMRPRCRSTISLVIARPSPVPLLFFCTEEGFEDPGLDCRRNSVSVIGKKYMHFSIGAPGTNLQGAFWG